MDAKLRDEIAQVHAQFCRGLSDPTRVMIVYLLSQKNHNVNELVEHLDLPQPTVSRHLKILRDRGIVIAKREGQCVQYHLSDSRITDALDLLRSIMADQLASKGDLAQSVTELSNL